MTDKKAKRFRRLLNAEQREQVLDSTFQNACDTIFVEKAQPLSEAEYMLRQGVNDGIEGLGGNIQEKISLREIKELQDEAARRNYW